jgi:hypothetical protein
MGSKYKESLEQKWDGKPISAMRVKILQDQADKNITNIAKGKLKVLKRRLK